MFDINDMAKAAFEPVLFTPLQRAQKDGYINITDVDGKKKIEFITLVKIKKNKWKMSVGSSRWQKNICKTEIMPFPEN